MAFKNGGGGHATRAHTTRHPWLMVIDEIKYDNQQYTWLINDYWFCIKNKDYLYTEDKK